MAGCLWTGLGHKQPNYREEEGRRRKKNLTHASLSPPVPFAYLPSITFFLVCPRLTCRPLCLCLPSAWPCLLPFAFCLPLPHIHLHAYTLHCSLYLLCAAVLPCHTTFALHTRAPCLLPHTRLAFTPSLPHPPEKAKKSGQDRIWTRTRQDMGVGTRQTRTLHTLPALLTLPYALGRQCRSDRLQMVFERREEEEILKCVSQSLPFICILSSLISHPPRHPQAGERENNHLPCPLSSLNCG